MVIAEENSCQSQLKQNEERKKCSQVINDVVIPIQKSNRQMDWMVLKSKCATAMLSLVIVFTDYCQHYAFLICRWLKRKTIAWINEQCNDVNWIEPTTTKWNHMIVPRSNSTTIGNCSNESLSNAAEPQTADGIIPKMCCVLVANKRVNEAAVGHHTFTANENYNRLVKITYFRLERQH